jgi:hypothetical protein
VGSPRVRPWVGSRCRCPLLVFGHVANEGEDGGGGGDGGDGATRAMGTRCTYRCARDARHRRLVASVNGRTRAPWTLNEVEWDAAHLNALVSGGSTGSTLVERACNRLGCGDLNILIERDRYLARTSGVEATVWTLDGGLAAYV